MAPGEHELDTPAFDIPRACWNNPKPEPEAEILRDLLPESLLNFQPRALAGWLRVLEHYPVHQKITVLIPSQGTYLGCRFNLLSG